MSAWVLSYAHSVTVVGGQVCIREKQACTVQVFDVENGGLSTWMQLQRNVGGGGVRVKVKTSAMQKGCQCRSMEGAAWNNRDQLHLD